MRAPSLFTVSLLLSFAGMSSCATSVSREAFVEALKVGHVDMVREAVQTEPALLQECYRAGITEKTPLELALYYRNADSVSALLQLGAVCSEEDICAALWSAQAPAEATEQQILACLDALMQHSPALLKNEKFYSNAMEMAIHHGSALSLEYFLSRGISAETVTENGWTLLDYAIAESFTAGAELLRKYGAVSHPHADGPQYPDFDALMKEL